MKLRKVSLGKGRKNCKPDFSWGIYTAGETEPKSLNSTVLPVATTDLLLTVFSPPHNDLLVPVLQIEIQFSKTAN